MCTAAVPLWTPASPQRGWLIYVSVPTPLEQWPLCAGRRRGVSWSATAARIRAVPPSPPRPATRTLHTLLHGLCCIHKCSLPLAPGHTGRPARSPSAQHRAALSSTSVHLGRKIVFSRYPITCQDSLHRDALPHASLAVMCISSPGPSMHILERQSSHSVRSVSCASRATWSLTSTQCGAALWPRCTPPRCAVSASHSARRPVSAQLLLHVIVHMDAHIASRQAPKRTSVRPGASPGRLCCSHCQRIDGSIVYAKSCDPPAALAVLCYLVNGGTAGGSDPSLSSGAIAGISIAVIVVVSGLVGFLCWWFICRGKA